MNKTVTKIARGPFAPLFSLGLRAFNKIQYCFLSVKWRLKGAKLPDEKDKQLVCENVTFLFKSFQRQKMATSLYRNIQKYYPNVKVVVVDDSKKPFPIKPNGNLEVVQLPFNSGLGYGLNRGLERVTTPFVIRMDDDELLTPYTEFHKHLRFLLEHEEIDLVGVSHLTAPKCRHIKHVANNYFSQTMANAPKKLKIPHYTRIGGDYVVLGKVPNIFVARTEALKSVGYDDNIRMIDHHDFFYRAAGNIVSAFAPRSFVYHRHDHFDREYEKYRSDYKNDLAYIQLKNKNIEKQ